MTLQQTAQIIGGIGVIASIIYAAIQIRNNTRAVRAAAFQQMANSISGQLDELARNAGLCSLLLRGSDDFESLSRVDKARFRFHTTSHMSRVENAYIQHRMGTLKDDHWIGIRNGMIASLDGPGRRTAWGLIRNRLNPDFRDYVDKIVDQAATVAATVPITPTPEQTAVPKKQKTARQRNDRQP